MIHFHVHNIFYSHDEIRSHQIKFAGYFHMNMFYLSHEDDDDDVIDVFLMLFICVTAGFE